MEPEWRVMIKVSVIVPVYNTEAMLRTCIESLIHQTLQEIEMIFIEDGSTDGSPAVLQEYQEEDARIRILYNERNMGAAGARNRGLAIAEGKYIQFVDSDDFIDLNALEVLYQAAEADHLDMCYVGMKIHGEGNANRNSNRNANKEADRNVNKNADNSKLQESICGKYPGVYKGRELIEMFVEKDEFFLYLCSVFYRREFVRENELWFQELRIGEGGDFILRALCMAQRAAVCGEKLYHYRVHENSVMHGADAKKELLAGQIAQYISVLRLFAQEDNRDGLVSFLRYQYRKIAGGIQMLSVKDRKEIEDKLEDGFAKYVFCELLQENALYGIAFDSETIRRIQQKDMVIVYGAGYASRELTGVLQQHGVEIIGFAVTKRNNGKTSLYGHHVYEIQELEQYRDRAIVLVAANRKYNREIGETLEQYGFLDTVFLDVKI